jgi:hypothetical protein
MGGTWRRDSRTSIAIEDEAVSPSLRPHAIEVEVFGRRLLCLDLDTLIRVKEAAGRPRHFEATAELRVIREGRDTPESRHDPDRQDPGSPRGSTRQRGVS